MTQDIFSNLFTASQEFSDRGSFESCFTLSSIWGDKASGADLLRRAEICGDIWDLAHMSLADIRKAAGLSQGGLSKSLCIPVGTIRTWEQRDCCAPYIRLMIARLLGVTNLEDFLHVD